MTPELALTLGILAVAVIAFVSDKVRPDFVALGIIAALPISGVLTIEEALAGFADPLVMMIAGLFVVSASLVNTGVAGQVGRWLAHVAGGNEITLLVAVMIASGVISAFMSSTGTVAVMLPIVVAMAKRARVSPSKLLIPLAFATLLGGMLTLIATPPNIVAAETMTQAGLPAFGFFSYTPIGAVFLITGVVFMVFIGRKLLPADAPLDSADDDRLRVAAIRDQYGLQEHVTSIVLPPNAAVLGETLRTLRLPERFELQVVAVRRAGQYERAVADVGMEAGLELLLQGTDTAIERFAAAYELTARPVSIPLAQLPEHFAFGEMLITPRSEWIGKTLASLDFRKRFRALVIGIQRGAQTITTDLRDVPLRFGDSLLVKVSPLALTLLEAERHNAIMSGDAFGDLPAKRAGKAPWALGILAGMLGVMVFSLVPLALAVILAVLALVATRTVTLDESYRAIHWQTVVLIAGVLPLATALQKTGAIDVFVTWLTGALGGYSPFVMFAGVYVATVLVTQLISNTATAVLLAPVALHAALAMEVNPAPFLMAIAAGASAVFISPISSPVNALVFAAGQYRVRDFVRVGVPLQVLILVVSLVLIPLLFPF